MSGSDAVESLRKERIPDDETPSRARRSVAASQQTQWLLRAPVIPGPTGPKPSATKEGSMTETERCWLVERDYWDKNLVTLVYATPDGERAQTSQRSTTMLRRDPPTAATEVPVDDLESVTDETERERYAHEVERVREQYEPDDEI
jgi:hypothetical protein